MDQPVAADSALTDPQERTLSLGTLVLLGCLTAVAPLVTDLYLPALPELAVDLGLSDAGSQLTMSVCLVGLALGQLVAGPLSDRVGRLRPLRWGVTLLSLTSFLCALAPDATTLLVLRLLQGLAGSAALVVSRAIVRDLYDGARAAKVFSELMLVMALAPVLGPVAGGQLLRFTDWRGIFVFLGVLGLLLALAVVSRLSETHPPSARTDPRHPARDVRLLLSGRTFLTYLAMSSLFGVVLFSYISMSPFVLQDGYGLSAAGYSLAFAANAIGLVVGSQVNSRLVVRHGPAVLLRWALRLAVIASVLVAVTMWLHLPLPLPLVPLWFVLVALGGTMGNAATLALGPHAVRAGTAAALLGTAQFLLGATVPPLASLGGATGTAMGVTMAVASVLAMAAERSVPTDLHG